MGKKKISRLLAVWIAVFMVFLSPLQILAVTVEEVGEKEEKTQSDVKKADVVFLIDSTGSMSDEIESVRNGIEEFVNELLDNDVDLRVGIVEYRDITCDGNDSTVIHTVNYSPWHNNIEDIKNTLNDIEADGGGDVPETLIDAMGYLTNGDMKFRSDAYKFAFVLTDATYKETNRHGYVGMNQMLEELQKYSISASVVTYSSYYDNSYEAGDEGDDYYDDLVKARMSILEESFENSAIVDSSNGEEEVELSQEEELEIEIKEEKTGSYVPSILSDEEMKSAFALKNGDSVVAEISENSAAVYSFVPEVNGIYCLTAESEEDNYGALYNSDGQMLYSNDDYDGRNFRIKAALAGGTKYYFVVSFYNLNTVGKCNLFLDGTEIKGTAGNCSYRQITEATNGILADINDNFSETLMQFAAQIMSITKKSKKAIYILPGYMGSCLYTSSGEEVWVNTDYLVSDVKKYAVPGGEDSILMLNEDGSGSKVKADISKDAYGSQDTYKNLVEKLKEKCGEEYDVVFFPYNWLGDLSDSAKSLEQHIKANGYKDVVFVTHSTGGLLASNFIARSRANKELIEKAILIAAPLYGTYTALQPVETGKTQDLDNMLKNNGVGNTLGVVYPVVHNWVKAITKNSPTTYQLFPSEEYLRMAATIYKDKMDNPITSSSDYYSILNQSGNINSNLTNGNNKSHDHFRSSILGNDVIKVLKSVDTLLIGSKRGHDTPAISVYERKLFGGVKLKDIIYQDDGDGTVMGFSAFAMRKQNKHELSYKNYDNVSHGDLASKSEILDYICQQINNPDEETVGIITEEEETVGTETSSAMTEKIKFNISSNQPMNLKVYDTEGAEVNIMEAGSGEYIYSPISQEEDDYSCLLYIPSSGWRVEIYSQQNSEQEIEGTVAVSLLNSEGFKTDSSVYPFHVKTAVTDTPISVFALDGIQVNRENLGILQENSEVTSETYPTQWTVDPQMTLQNIGDKAQVGLSGEDVDKGNIRYGDLQWASADETIASVDGEGNITANGYGQTIVSAVQSGSNQIYNCTVTVRKYASSVEIPNITLKKNERVVLEPVFDASDVTETELTYTCSDEGVIEIADGVVYGLKEGTETVTATAEGGASTTFLVTVTDAKEYAVTSVTLSSEYEKISVGDTLEIFASVLPENAFDKTVSWYIEDDSVLEKVDEDSDSIRIRGLRLGTSRLYAVSQDGGFSVSAQIQVAGQIQAELKQSSYNYEGKTIIPKLSVTYDGYELSQGIDYTVTYKNNNAPGTASVTVTGIGNYQGSKTFKFSIKLKKPTLGKAVNTSSGITLTWSKVPGAYGYRVYRKAYGKNWTRIKTLNGNSTLRYTDTSVKNKNGQTFIYTVRAYTKSISGPYDTTGKKIVRLSTPGLYTPTNKGKQSIAVKWKKCSGASGYQIQYSTSAKFSNAKSVNISSQKTVSKTITKLPKKTYYVRVRSYKKSGKSVFYSGWSTAKKVKVVK